MTRAASRVLSLLSEHGSIIAAPHSRGPGCELFMGSPPWQTRTTKRALDELGNAGLIVRAPRAGLPMGGQFSIELPE